MKIEKCLFLKTKEMVNLLIKKILDTNPDENVFGINLDETYPIETCITNNYAISSISIAYYNKENPDKLFRTPGFVHSDFGNIHLTVDLPFEEGYEPSINEIIMAFVFRQKFT